MGRSPNRLLSALSTEAYASIQKHLRTVTLSLGDVVAEAGSRVRKVYFPHTGIISLVVELNVGDMIETAMVGRDGVLNGAAALDGALSLNKAVVQVSGTASIIEVAQLRSAIMRFKDFGALIIRHEQVLFAQSQQSAACNASHSVEERMCKWLLRMRDLANGDDLLLTQGFLAQMLGVRRPSISIVANTLQREGLIKYSRGHLRILNTKGLRKGSCECYATVKRHYDRLLK